MSYNWTCPDHVCGAELSADTAEGLIKRAAAHNHEHHGGPAQITPELEAMLRSAMSVGHAGGTGHQTHTAENMPIPDYGRQA